MKKVTKEQVENALFDYDCSVAARTAAYKAKVPAKDAKIADRLCADYYAKYTELKEEFANCN